MAGRPKRPPKLNPISMPGAGGGGGGVDNISTVVNTPNNLDRKTKISFDDETIEVEPEDLEVVDQLGRGAYGIVERVRHTRSGKEMAVKRITAISQEQKSLLMDMNVLVQGSQCPNIVKFYGALFWDGDLWIFMEIMDTSLDKFYKKFYKSQLVNQLKNRELILTNPGESRNDDDDDVVDGGAVNGKIPEKVLGKIAASVVNALHYLHTIKIIHRDVKPSNILINRRGQVKLCDFGISGYLVNSIAQTYEAGCKPYMAPERINPDRKREGYDIRSDVWSLGITMVELATGEFPYPAAANFFLQLKRVCTDNPPRLPAGIFSPDFEDFIVQCLQKDYQKRPNYSTLMEHSFVKTHRNNDISEFVSLVLDNDASDQCDN